MGVEPGSSMRHFSFRFLEFTCGQTPSNSPIFHKGIFNVPKIFIYMSLRITKIRNLANFMNQRRK